jgi:hypothetical protein
VTAEAVAFEGHDCVRLDRPGGSVLVTVSAGPRVLGLFGVGENVMAVLPGAGLERPGGTRFAFIGGHRLWAAPEVPEVTYAPDDRPCEVTEVDAGARVTAPADDVGLIRSLEIRASDDGWIVDHAIRNASDAPITIAPWAITQLRPGGEARLPLGARGTGLQADRSLVLWPYTRLDDPRLSVEGDAVRIQAREGDGATKLGAAPGAGRVSYTLGDEVFEKRIAVVPSGTYADRGAAVQVYVGDGFCELETLGPVRAVGPGERVEHRERWTLGVRGAVP